MSVHNRELNLKHLFDSSEWNVYDTTILNLGVGAPGTDLLENCCDIFQKATQHRLRHEKEANSAMLFQYGPTSGCYYIRNEIAKYFSQMYGSEMKSEDLIITAGATQGLHFVLSTLVDFNGFVFVDEFTYMLALDCIKQFHTFQIVPIKLNDDGVDLADFAEKIQGKRFISQSKVFWAIYYTIPTYHNPTGILFSPQVCRGIVELARKHDFLVLCDDVYNILHYREARLYARLFSYDSRSDHSYLGNVISNGSFSKILGPGVRLGWLEVPARLKPILDRSGINNSGGCFNNYTAGIVASLFELRLAQPHISRVYATYKDRMLTVIGVLRNYLHRECEMVLPAGGYFIWVRLAHYMDAREFLDYCLQHEKIFFIPGARFATEEGKGKNCLRLSIAFHDKARLVDGAERFCRALSNYIDVLNTV